MLGFLTEWNSAGVPTSYEVCKCPSSKSLCSGTANHARALVGDGCPGGQPLCSSDAEFTSPWTPDRGNERPCATFQNT